MPYSSHIFKSSAHISCNVLSNNFPLPSVSLIVPHMSIVTRQSHIIGIHCRGLYDGLHCGSSLHILALHPSITYPSDQILHHCLEITKDQSLARISGFDTYYTFDNPRHPVSDPVTINALCDPINGILINSGSI